MYFEFKAVDRNSIAIVDKHKEKITGVVAAVTHFFSNTIQSTYLSS